MGASSPMDFGLLPGTEVPTVPADKLGARGDFRSNGNPIYSHLGMQRYLFENKNKQTKKTHEKLVA